MPFFSYWLFACSPETGICSCSCCPLLFLFCIKFYFSGTFKNECALAHSRASYYAKQAACLQSAHLYIIFIYCAIENISFTVFESRLWLYTRFSYSTSCSFQS